MADKVVVETLPSGEKKTYVIPVYAPVTAPSSQQWYATAQDLFNRGYLSVEIDGERIPVPNTPNLSHSFDTGTLKINDTQLGYFKNKSDQEQRKNYQNFYGGSSGYTNKFGKYEIWKLRDEYIQYQQILSDNLGITTYKPNQRENHSKNNKAVTAISTMPRTAGEPRKPAGAGAIDPEAIPQEIEEPSIQTSGAGQPRQPAGAGVMSPDATPQTIEEPSIQTGGAGQPRHETPTTEPVSTLDESSTLNESIFEFEILPEAGAEENGIIPHTPDMSTSNSMIKQEIINFSIVNNRIKGSIKFTATNSFNPYYYNKIITNYLQLKSKGVTLLIKNNNLRFSETERDELINFDENAFDLDVINAESQAWTQRPNAMSNILSFTIEKGKPVSSSDIGIMGAGFAGGIALLILGGFIAGYRK